MSRRKGSTLLELLVVFAIIALVASIIVPWVRLSREAARRAVCRANLRHIGVAELMYADDNNAWTTRIVWSDMSGPDARYGNVAWCADALTSTGVTGPVGVGLLPAGGYTAEDGRLFYCPSQTAWSCQYDNPDIGWYFYGKSVEYAPGYQSDPFGAAFIGFFMRRSQRLLGPPRVIAGDMWYADHWRTCHDGEGISIVYSDGSVRWLTDDRAGFRVAAFEPAAVEQVWELLDEEY